MEIQSSISSLYVFLLSRIKLEMKIKIPGKFSKYLEIKHASKKGHESNNTTTEIRKYFEQNDNESITYQEFVEHSKGST